MDRVSFSLQPDPSVSEFPQLSIWVSVSAVPIARTYKSQIDHAERDIDEAWNQNSWKEKIRPN